MAKTTRIKVDAVSKKNLGVKSGDTWYNWTANGGEITEDKMRTLFENIEKGDIVDIETVNKNSFNLMRLVSKGPSNVDKKDFPKFGELLMRAHKKFKKLSIETEIIHIEDFNCLMKAVVTTEKGKYTAIGDATKQNTTSTVSMALPRMAETRAVSRALRFAIGEGKTAMEEVYDESEQDDAE